MKKFLFPIALVFSLIACNNQEDVTVPTNSDETISFSRFRSPQQAWDIANGLLCQDEQSRCGRALRPISDVEIISTKSSRSGETDTLYYAIDVEDNGGFILIAAPRSAEPVMAIIEDGSYNDPANLENEAYQMILSEMVAGISFPKLPEDGDDGPLPLEPWYWEDTITGFTREGPNVKVAWNQRWPENIYAPNGLAGCAAVAVGQVLSYFESPNSINYQCKDFDIQSEILNWSNLKLHKRSTTNLSDRCVNCTGSNDTHLVIGRLMRELGFRMNSRYRNDSIISTGTNSDSMAIVFTELTGVSQKAIGYGFNNLFSSLQDSGVALVRGYEFTDEGEVTRGHGWVADGYKLIFHEIKHYELNNTLDPSLGKYIITRRTESESELIHFNWGWGGRCNGWFNIVNLWGDYSISSDEAYSHDYLEVNPPKYSPHNYFIKYWFYQK